MDGSFCSLSDDSFCEAASFSGETSMAPPPSKLHPATTIMMRLVTEDTPPDMLAGSMDLRVTLPNGKTAKMSVERSTPMMDLLIQITTAHKVSPGDHILQAMGDKGVLPYKPSTPIGALDTMSIRVVPRNNKNAAAINNALNSSKKVPLINSLIGSQQPFEQTFRLQVRLPRNQLFVARMSARTPLADILQHVCDEKNLDPNKYEFRHPVNTDQSLQLSLCLADYKITEVVVVPRGSRPSTELSSSDIPALQQRNNDETRNGGSSAGSSGSGSGGVLSSLLKRNKSDGNREGSLSGDSLGGRSSSPARSDESLGRSISPPVAKIMDRSQNQAPPVRHRKGRAPKPPTPAPKVPVEAESAKKKAEEKQQQPDRTALVISHSRNSSDSSGYHEASVLSDTPDNHNGHTETSPAGTINREGRPRAATSAAPPSSYKAHQQSPSKLQYSLSMSDVSTKGISVASGRMSNATSTSSLSNKKKKAPAPPPATAAPAAPDAVLMPPPQQQQSTKPTPTTSSAAAAASSSRSSSRSSSVLESAASTAEKSPATDEVTAAPCVPVLSENGLTDSGSSSHSEEELEVQVQMEKEDSEYASDDDLDSAFQSVTDVLEKQLLAEELLLKQQQQEAEELLEKQRLLLEEEMLQKRQQMLAEELLQKEQQMLREAQAKQAAKEAEGKNKILRELEMKRALHEKQRLEIERLQREQQELEVALQKFENESSENTQKPDSHPETPEPTESAEWEYKLPAPPSAFRDTKETATPTNSPEEEKRRLSYSGAEISSALVESSVTSPEPPVFIPPEIRIEQVEPVSKVTSDEDEDEEKPKPPEIVEVRVKPSVVNEVVKRRSNSPPRVTIVPLRSAHSLCSLVYDLEEKQQQLDSRKSSTSSEDSAKVQSPLRKTISVDDVSKTGSTTSAPEAQEQEEQRLQQLQQQLVNWQKQLITNQSVLQEHVDMPLQSLQVLREILPQMKQKLEDDAINGTSRTTITETITTRSSTLPRGPRAIDLVSLDSSSNTLDRRTTSTTTMTMSSSSASRGFRPPQINLGTWIDRPKSEISLKQDSDYRIGVGQLQARATPVVRQAEPKPPKENLNLISSNDAVSRSNSWRVTQQPPYKSSVTINSLATEQVRARNKPTVVLRQQPMSLNHVQSQAPPPPEASVAPGGYQRRYTTLVGVNGAPQPTMVAAHPAPVPVPVVSQHAIRPLVITQATAVAASAPSNGAANGPVVKGFVVAKEPPPVPVKISPLAAAPVPPPAAPMPPPPPFAQQYARPALRKAPPKQVVTQQADPRDQLMNAIKNFGGRSNLRRVRSTQ